MDIWHSASQVPPRTLTVAWVASYIGFIAVNVASNAGVFGATNAEVSKRFPVPLTPAGYAPALPHCTLHRASVSLA